ncbi:MAG: alpha/beta fold hydrolase [Bdellovibrio sp.]
MERINIFFLHGFLGRPSDWDAVKVFLSQRENVRVYVPDYFNEPFLGPENSFENWSENFNSWAQGLVGFSNQNILVGYSLGGRLALHALEKKTELWKKVICISTNAGFVDDFQETETGIYSSDFLSEERRLRAANDARWAQEFLNSDWQSVMQAWNAQSVFGGGGNEPVRLEKDYRRKILSQSLKQWSLSLQKNKRSVLQRNAEKIFWLIGEKDKKFVELAYQLKADIPSLNIDFVSNASHRVLFDNPQNLSETISRVILEIIEEAYKRKK